MAIRDAEFARWLVSSLGSGLVAVDGQGCLVALSHGARRLLRIEPELDDALGRDCREVLSGQPGLVRLMLDAVGGREVPSRAELLLDGSGTDEPRRIGFTVVPVHGDRGPRGAALLFRDLTPFERMDEQERLRDRLAALGEMAAGMAHEIRNPLAGMEVLAGLLKRRLADRPEELSLVEDLLGELRRVADTISESLDFVKPMVPVRVGVDPVELLEACLAVARSRVACPCEVVRHYPPTAERLLADDTQLRAVLSDLIVNALEAMGADAERPPRLELSVSTALAPTPLLRVGEGGSQEGGVHRHEVVFSIADNGPGVPPELADRVFHPFFTTKRRGSGIGLANAQKVAASHGGSLELERGRQQGATFHLRLPRETDA